MGDRQNKSKPMVAQSTAYIISDHIYSATVTWLRIIGLTAYRGLRHIVKPNERPSMATDTMNYEKETNVTGIKFSCLKSLLTPFLKWTGCSLTVPNRVF